MPLSHRLHHFAGKLHGQNRLLAVAGSLLVMAMVGCGSGVPLIAVDLTRTVATPTDGSAALAYLATPVVQAGGPAATVTLHGAGLQQTSQLVLDGVPHAATYQSASDMQFTLSVAELVTPRRHNVQVRNSGTQVPISNALTLLVSPGYTALGDSITFGGGLASRADAYPFLLSSMFSLNLTDSGVNGDQACDLFPHQIYGQLGYTPVAVPLYSLMVSTNDADHYGAGSYEAVYNHCHRAAIAWLGTSRTDKLLPGDPGITATGACDPVANAQYQGGIACSPGTTGTITASDFTTTGHPLYIWYTLSDAASATATFDVSIDGQLQTTVSSKPEAPISTFNGTTQSVSLVRLPLNAGQHRVVITTAGGVAIQGIGTNRGGAAIPQVVVGDIPWQLQGAFVASLADQTSYSADIKANIASAIADGMDIRFAQHRVTMLGLRDEMFDQVHPNALGHKHLASAFLIALQ